MDLNFLSFWQPSRSVTHCLKKCLFFLFFFPRGGHRPQTSGYCAVKMWRSGGHGFDSLSEQREFFSFLFSMKYTRQCTGSPSSLSNNMHMKSIYNLCVLYFGEKRVELKGSSRISRSRIWLKLARISHKIEGEDTMEKHLKVFQAR